MVRPPGMADKAECATAAQAARVADDLPLHPRDENTVRRTHPPVVFGSHIGIFYVSERVTS